MIGWREQAKRSEGAVQNGSWLGSGLAVLCLGAVLGCTDGPSVECPQDLRHPNVFLIVIDAASAMHFGFNGGEPGTSPNLDRLASESVVFETAYAQAPITVTSTASLITGLRGTTHLVTPGTRLPAHLPTLAESLREAGYKTFGVIGNPFAGAPGLGFDRGYDEFVLVYAMRSLRGKRAREKSTHFLVTLPADINGQVFSLLPRFERSRTFAHIHYLQPHKPYDPPAEFLEAFLSEGGEHGVAAQSWDRVHREFERANTTGETTQDVIATLEARYRANIRFVDEGIGELLERLRVDDLYDEAMIVLLSDHGDAFFKHRRFGHRKTLYDDMTRIPLLIKFPASDGIAPRRFPDLVETVDVLPTLLDRLCIPSIERMEGESLLPLVRGERNGLSGSEVLLATSSRRLLAIRRGDFKYIIHVQSEVEEIYDLRRDPDEQDNLAETHPELLRDLRRALEARVDLRSHSKRELEEKNLLRNDPEMNRLLNALGYTEGGEETDDH